MIDFINFPIVLAHLCNKNLYLKLIVNKKRKNLCVEGFLCASVVGCGNLSNRDPSVVKGAVLRVGRISGRPGHCLGSIRSTSSSGSRSRSTELTGDCPESIDSGPLTASLTLLFAVLLIQGSYVALLAPTRSICSPSIAFKRAGGYQVMLHDKGHCQQLSNKIHHMFVFTLMHYLNLICEALI